MNQTRPSILPISIFAHADNFFAALSKLHETPRPNVGAIAAPAMVIAAFASELYLKCFICLENGFTPRGHYLHDLYMELPANARAAIESHWNAIIRDREELLSSLDRQTGRSFHRNLDEALKEGNRAFEQLRYIYENTGPFRFAISDFPVAIRRALLDRKSNWGQQDALPIGLSYPHAVDTGARREGTIDFWINHPNIGWHNDADQYQFSQDQISGINVTVFKTPDCRISVTISGPLGRTFLFNHPMPSVTLPKGLHLAITWTAQSVVLYLDGKPAITIDPTL
jgi:hypothetical protein